MTTTPEQENPQQPEPHPQAPAEQLGENAQQTTPLPELHEQPTVPQPEIEQALAQQGEAPQATASPQEPQAQALAQPQAQAQAQAPHAVTPQQEPQAQAPAPAPQPGEAHSAAHTPAPQAYYAPHPSHLGAQEQGAPAPEATQGAPVTDSHAAPAAEAPQRKSRAGVFFAGIAIGAVVAGVVGGGAGALVAANQGANTVVQSPTTGRVTFNNADTSTNVSAVALAATPSVVTLSVVGPEGAGSGSGVIYSKDGYIITNAHVVTLDGEAGPDPKIRVSLSDGRVFDAEVVGVDPFADLAVVKVNADDLVPIEVADSSKINVGDLTVAIGAPLNLPNTVTSGVVSALNRGISVGSPIIPEQPNGQQDQPDSNDQSDGLPWYRFGSPEDQGQQQQQQQQQSQSTATTVTLPVIQTDASINPGNSGGALLNSNAELIGINVAIASNGNDSSTAGSVGLGFAIPSNMVARVADALIAGERPSHGLLGIGVKDSSADTDEDRNFAGGLISELVSGGPAESAGLKVGDVITAVDGVPADSGTSVSALVRMHAGGEKVTVSYVRGGKAGEAEVTLGALDW